MRKRICLRQILGLKDRGSDTRAVTLLLDDPARAEATMAGADDLAQARLDVARRPPVASA